MAYMEIRQRVSESSPVPVKSGLRLRALTVALGLLVAPFASAQPTFLAGGQELSAALKEHASSYGWSLRWNAGEDYFLDVDQMVPGATLIADVEHVLGAYQDRGALEGVRVTVNAKAKTISLERGAGRRAPVTDQAVALRASAIGKSRLAAPAQAWPTALALGPARPTMGPATVATAAPTAVVANKTAGADIAMAVAAPASNLTAPPAFAVLPGDLMSTVLERWTKGSAYKVVWEADSDFRLQAGANFQGKTMMQAIEELAQIVSRTHAGLQIRAYRNGVIRVTEAGK